jgi:hypothetical protein
VEFQWEHNQQLVSFAGAVEASISHTFGAVEASTSLSFEEGVRNLFCKAEFLSLREDFL